MLTKTERMNQFKSVPQFYPVEYRIFTAYFLTYDLFSVVSCCMKTSSFKLPTYWRNVGHLRQLTLVDRLL